MEHELAAADVARTRTLVFFLSAVDLTEEELLSRKRMY